MSRNRLYPKLQTSVSCGSDQPFCTEDSSSSIDRSHESESSHSDMDTSISGVPLRRQRNQMRRGSKNSNWNYIYIFCVIVGILVVACMFVRFPNSSRLEDTLLRKYRQRMGRLLKEKYPREESNTKNILRLLGEKWINQERMEPYTVLITGSKAKIFASDITSVFTEVLQRGEVEKIFCDAQKERHQLDNEIASSLKKTSKTVILNDIDKLRGEAPLSLHSLCDPDYSPHPSALILLTITRSSLGSYPKCEQAVSSLLLDEWQTGFMDSNKISPILSRITSYVICLES